MVAMLRRLAVSLLLQTFRFLNPRASTWQMLLLNHAVIIMASLFAGCLKNALYRLLIGLSCISFLPQKKKHASSFSRPSSSSCRPPMPAGCMPRPPPSGDAATHVVLSRPLQAATFVVLYFGKTGIAIVRLRRAFVRTYVRTLYMRLCKVPGRRPEKSAYTVGQW